MRTSRVPEPPRREGVLSGAVRASHLSMARAFPFVPLLLWGLVAGCDECSDNEDCETFEYCLVAETHNVCRERECLGDAQCAGSDFCNDNGVCVDSCSCAAPSGAGSPWRLLVLVAVGLHVARGRRLFEGRGGLSPGCSSSFRSQRIFLDTQEPDATARVTRVDRRGRRGEATRDLALPAEIELRQPHPEAGKGGLVAGGIGVALAVGGGVLVGFGSRQSARASSGLETTTAPGVASIVLGGMLVVTGVVLGLVGVGTAAADYDAQPPQAVSIEVVVASAAQPATAVVVDLPPSGEDLELFYDPRAETPLWLLPRRVPTRGSK